MQTPEEFAWALYEEMDFHDHSWKVNDEGGVVAVDLIRARDAEARAEVERLRSAADSLFEKALERGAHGQLPAVNIVEINEAFKKEIP